MDGEREGAMDVDDGWVANVMGLDSEGVDVYEICVSGGVCWVG